jgi:hypothetical protein
MERKTKIRSILDFLKLRKKAVRLLEKNIAVF